jgi:hypothetical protein
MVTFISKGREGLFLNSILYQDGIIDIQIQAVCSLILDVCQKPDN